jgi:predicted N-acetyltransferase YhbS
MREYAMQTKQFAESEMTLEMAKGIATIACRSFPSAKSIEERVAEMTDQKDADTLEFQTGRRFVVVGAGGMVVAHARTFVREVKTEDGETLPVLALATVCSDPDVRGKGYGAEVTKSAFAQVGDGDWPGVSLFQTPVPEFYEKLNCRIVDNKFVDRTNADSPDSWPWRDDIAMIYPSTFAWPDGVIDINGPDY